MTVILVDTTVLSNFAHVKRPTLLLVAFENLSAPHSVMEELAEGEKSGRVPQCDWSGVSIVDLSPEESAYAAALRQTLGKGEADCIAIARTRGGIVLTDDRDARRVAQAVGVDLSGTLGALVNLVDQGTLSIAQADELLAEMQRHGYHSPVNSLSELEDH
jgi:predicted nucleic acid-binding protein